MSVDPTRRRAAVNPPSANDWLWRRRTLLVDSATRARWSVTSMPGTRAPCATTSRCIVERNATTELKRALRRARPCGEASVERLDHPVQIAAFGFIGADLATQSVIKQRVSPRGQRIQLAVLPHELGGDQSPLIGDAPRKYAACSESDGRVSVSSTGTSELPGANRNRGQVRGDLDRKSDAGRSARCGRVPLGTTSLTRPMFQRLPSRRT